MTIRSVVIAVLSDFAHIRIKAYKSNHNVFIYCCMIEFEWKYVNVMHETSFTSMLVPMQ